MFVRTSHKWLNSAAKATCALTLLLYASSATARAQTDETLQKILRTHQLVVGTIGNNPPWEFTKPDGELDGYDIAIAKAIAADLGAKVTFVQMSGAARIPALQTHKVDLVVAELDYNPQRAETIAYTRAYANPTTLESLNDPNVTIGYALGGDEATILPKLLPKARLKAFTTTADAVQALLSGEVTATGEPTVVDIPLMKSHPGALRMVEPPYSTAITGIGLSAGDFAWWLWMDRWVDSFNFSGANQRLWVDYVGGGSPLVN
jgi:ABC-type amino acid transport substrate-binding protein